MVGKWSSIRRILGRGATSAFCVWAISALGQEKAWFVDGFHGGLYGHYPPSSTQFMVDSLRANAGWKLNLEIEPETWDFVSTNTPEAYAAFKQLAADQSATGRIEFINPAYAQSYLWNIPGENIIQQFVRGMEKLHVHFPNAKFDTYSSEEPCFTSALPGILKSLDFKNAVLKNPNTCWGGYTRAFGGELVNWIGPDGTVIPTVPRYAMESLKENSTWETIANANDPKFFETALQSGIKHPVGMCIQDAGWQNGPWLRRGNDGYEPTEFTIWRNYFQNVAEKKAVEDWRFSQEDVQVSLVWGAQVLQRIAQAVRRAESRVVTAEKMAALAGIYQHTNWPGKSLDDAWRTLMLSQHHDCWIVPYNGRRNHTWADQVAAWTGNTIQRSEEIIQQSARGLAGESGAKAELQLYVFNTLAVERTGIAHLALSDNWRSKPLVRDAAGNEVPSQVSTNDHGGSELIFLPTVPALGYATFSLDYINGATSQPTTAFIAKDGGTVLETDLYRIELNAAQGGTISSLVIKHAGNRQLVDPGSDRRFNELRGYFFKAGKFFSTADHPATIQIIKNGPVQAKVCIKGRLDRQTVTQTITLTQGQRRIDFNTLIDWQDSPGIGENFEQPAGFKPAHDHKAFYDDRFKLLTLFPANLQQQQIYKNAPFDVTHSQLIDTFFNSWSNIKNNVLLNWVDVFDPTNQMGLALLSDHTTSYAHGTNHPLGLTMQYSGIGLWGRDYSLRGPTEVNFALVPHVGDWEQAALWAENDSWNEPLCTQSCKLEATSAGGARSLLTFDRDGWEVPTIRLKNGSVYIRLFNASTEAARRNLTYDAPAAKVELLQLNDELLREIPVSKDGAGRTHFEMTLARFGVGTLRITP